LAFLFIYFFFTYFFSSYRWGVPKYQYC